jgi:hypothetical protein
VNSNAKGLGFDQLFSTLIDLAKQESNKVPLSNIAKGMFLRDVFSLATVYC